MTLLNPLLLYPYSIFQHHQLYRLTNLIVIFLFHSSQPPFDSFELSPAEYPYPNVAAFVSAHNGALYLIYESRDRCGNLKGKSSSEINGVLFSHRKLGILRRKIWGKSRTLLSTTLKGLDRSIGMMTTDRQKSWPDRGLTEHVSSKGERDSELVRWSFLRHFLGPCDMLQIFVYKLNILRF